VTLGTAAAAGGGPGPRPAGDRLVRFMCGWYAAAMVAGSLTYRVPAVQDIVITAAFVVLEVIATVCAARLWADRRQDPAVRAAWRWLTVAFVMTFLCGIAYGAAQGGADPARAMLVADCLRLAYFATATLGMLALPIAARRPRDRHTLALDLTTVASAVFMLVWYFVIGPGVTPSGPDWPVLLTIMLPTGAAILCCAGVRTLLRGPADPVRLPCLLLTCAAAVFLSPELYSGYRRVHGLSTYTQFPRWMFLVNLTAVFLSAVAAAYHRPGRSPRGYASAGGRLVGRVSLLPYAALGLGYLLLATVSARYGLYPLGGLVAAGAVMTGAVAARQVVAMWENHTLAVTDGLTGLANRISLRAELARALDRAARSGRPGAVLLLDLDGFKQTNDTYGHEAGDALLAGVAAVLREGLGPGDVAGRLGGDEFAVVLARPEGVPPGVVAARRILGRLAEPVVWSGHALYARVSIGIAVSQPGDSTGDLLHRADLAMYRAKRDGHHSYQAYEPSHVAAGPVAHPAGGPAAELRAALADGQLRVHYQPIVRLDTGAIVGAEALVRWQHPDRGLLGPYDFLPLAHKCGLIADIGEWVLHAATRELADWQRRLPPDRWPFLTVNVSPHQLTDDRLLSAVPAALAAAGVPPASLVLEITEDVAVDLPAAAPRLRRLHELGVRIALDDFGVGYSSLQQLTQLPIALLKVDRGLVADLPRPATEAVLAMVHGLCRAIHADTVAEGIETAAAAEHLRRLGYRYGQGYHFARPLPAADFAALLTAPDPAVATTA
jgi:diguanylate cyclase